MPNRRHVDPPAVEQLFDGQDLHLGMLLVAPRRFVESGAGRFLVHRPGRFFHREQHSDRSLLAGQDRDQTGHVVYVRVPGLHGKHDLLRLAGLAFIVEVEPSVDALINALL